MEQVTNEESIEMARRLAREEGSAVAVSPAARPPPRPSGSLSEEQFHGKTIVVILPDSGERYLSSVLFEGMFEI